MGLKIIIGILFITAASLSVVATNPTWRAGLKKIILNDQRRILAKAEAYLQPGGPMMKVFKIKSAVNGSDELSLEIYSSPDGGSQFNFVQKIDLPEKSDGYFTFNGNATNMVLADIDSDGFFEIVVPTFDEQGVARLHTFKYDSATRTFQKMLGQNN